MSKYVARLFFLVKNCHVTVFDARIELHSSSTILHKFHFSAILSKNQKRHRHKTTLASRLNSIICCSSFSNWVERLWLSINWRFLLINLRSHRSKRKRRESRLWLSSFLLLAMRGSKLSMWRLDWMSTQDLLVRISWPSKQTWKVSNYFGLLLP